MKADARLATSLRGNETILTQIRSDPPLHLRPTPKAVYLAGGAAGPLGGDEIGFIATLGSRTSLAVKSVGASLAMPGPAPSRTCVTVEVHEGANLEWHPEPLVSVAGSNHVQHTVISAGAGVTIRWNETVVLGRTGEDPGRLRTVMRCDRAGDTILHHELRIGDPGWSGPAVIGDFRFITNILTVGASEVKPSIVTGRGWAATWPIADDAWLTTVLAHSPRDTSNLIARLAGIPR